MAAQLGAWEKFVGDSGVMSYFHSAFQKLFLDGGMKDELIKLKEAHEGYRIWVGFLSHCLEYSGNVFRLPDIRSAARWHR